jgi:hypothetical protein
MPRTIMSISEPKWADAEQARADCLVTFLEGGDEVFPFTASPDDTEEHGREIFRRIAEGEAGMVAAYQAPPAPPLRPLSRRQFWLAALALGVTKDAVRAMVESHPDIDVAAALIEIDDAQQYEREHPLVDVLATALMLTKPQVDAAWQAAHDAS